MLPITMPLSKLSLLASLMLCVTACSNGNAQKPDSTNDPKTPAENPIKASSKTQTLPPTDSESTTHSEPSPRDNTPAKQTITETITETADPTPETDTSVSTVENYPSADKSLSGILTLTRHLQPLNTAQSLNTAPSLEGVRYHIATATKTGDNCNITGTIHHNNGLTYDLSGTLSQCKVLFQPQTDGSILITLNKDEACATYCGAGVDFSERFLPPQKACQSPNIAKVKVAFKTAYDNQQYAKAEKILSQYFQQCKTGVNSIEDFEISNDLAVTYLKLGNKAKCRTILAPFKDEVISTEGMMKFDTEEDAQYAQAVKNGKYNWQQCNK